MNPSIGTDFTFVLYAPSLDSYISAWEAAGEAFLPLTWTGDDDASTTYYSIVKQVPNTQVVFELVSASEPATLAKSGGGLDTGSLTFLEDPLVRVSASAFTDNGVGPAQSPAASSEEDGGILTPITVSKATSNMSAIDDYYVNVFKATLALESTATYSGADAFKAFGGANANFRAEKMKSKASSDYDGASSSTALLHSVSSKFNEKHLQLLHHNHF